MKKKILIIEDDNMLSGALSEWLLDEGFEVRVSGGVAEAFEEIAIDKPDVILTDLVMADFDGFEVLRRVKENSQLKNVLVLVMSNSGQDEDVEKATLLGAKDFMIKSDLSLKEIVKRVKKAVTEAK
jgi:DNA-binding response OmpR family regulator